MGDDKKEKETITVSGVTFSADQVKSATVKIGGREVYIGEEEDEPKKLGFKADDDG